MIKESPRNRADKNVWKKNNKNKNCHCKAIADITSPHYFGTSVSMVTPFWILSTHQKLPHTMVNIPTMFHERNQKILKIPLFLFPWQLRQSLSYRFWFYFGLSRSTTSGCCSCQVSSISVWRGTCYNHFCVFQFFCIFAVSMAMAAILKKSTINSTTSYGIWYSYKVS